MKIASWNINSVRSRQHLVADFLRDHAPDILCLQETKVEDDKFPRQFFEELGYGHQTIRGQKSYNGTAIIAKNAPEFADHLVFDEQDGARHVAARHDGVTIHNFYVPAGGDIPDPQANDKFAHKLRFLDDMQAYCASGHLAEASILVGDLNIAPSVHDVWSSKQLANVVSHTEVEINKLEAVRQAGGLVDAVRVVHPEPAMLYSWWSYRSPDFRKNNRGRRLDHIWVSPDLVGRIRHVSLLDDYRAREKPSDHIPLVLELT
ncbi:MAG TPA: exodeoxyribonuclease III [Alphaproteobacteria bacterium]|nr:exodeoxyribonuclease III [Alphaproteobacteria bacterium]